MEIHNRVDLVMDLYTNTSDVSRFSVVLWHVLYMHCSLVQTEFTATVAQTHKTTHNGYNYLKDGDLMLPERPD